VKSIKPVQKVIDSFESLPGIGPKSAARLAYYLLHVPQERLEKFADSLNRLRKDTKVCKICFNIGEEELCPICAESGRDTSIVCVVEQPLDLIAMERSEGFKGVYHILGGVISPLSNIGPDELFISQLLERVKTGKVKELIIATNPSMEGEATAMYITHKIREVESKKDKVESLKITRIGRGLPTGAEVEYADSMTLTRAMENRREM
jgi:recombination protein RecR